MSKRSMLAVLGIVMTAVGLTTPAAAAPGGGAVVESGQSCDAFTDPDTGNEIVFCAEHRAVTNETTTPSGVTVSTGVLDSSFSFTVNGVVVNTGSEQRQFTWVVRDGTQVFTFRSATESFFFGTLCTNEARVLIVGGELIIDEGETVCVVV